MKSLLPALAALLISPAFAFDYQEGRCPVPEPITITYASGTNQWTSGTAGPSDCAFQSAYVYQTFSDTMTFEIGPWVESIYNPPGEWVPESTTGVTVSDGGRWIGGGRGGGSHFVYYTIVESASIDGMSLHPPATGHTWTLGVDLAPGSHTFAVTGHGSGYSWITAPWNASVTGMQSVLQPYVASPGSDTSRRE